VWHVTQGEIAKAYRKLSVFVHPDKNSGDDARQAFEQLNQAYRTLKDPDKLVSRSAHELGVKGWAKGTCWFGPDSEAVVASPCLP
jgi:hypothetical protein